MEVDTEADAEAELVTVTVRVTVLPAEPVQAVPEAREDVKVVGEGASDEVKVVSGAAEEVVTVTSTEEEGMGVTERETAPFVSFVSFVDSAGALAILGPSRGPRRVRTLHAELPGHCWGKRGGC